MLQRLLPDSSTECALGNVSLLRLDALDSHAPGNKRYKLRGYVEAALASQSETLVSFGGAWSNHLHALAAVGLQHGLRTVGIVRCEPSEANSATLEEARSWGMEIVPVGRAQYRQRHLEAYQAALQQQYSPCIIIPEGGASALGLQGCADIAALILSEENPARRIVLPVGTGTTLAGVAGALPADYEVIGISALKGALNTQETVAGLLQQVRQVQPGNTAQWRILHDHHCGGFARVNDALKQFVTRFEERQGIALDPVYTAKMLLAISSLQRSGQWDADEPLIAIHTGGIQGRRGFAWLSNSD